MLELEDFAELLLDPIPPSGVQDDDKGSTLDEDFTELDDELRGVQNPIVM
jgi:hypothetical protein